MSSDERLTEYDHVINNFEKCCRGHDVEGLCEQVEYVRGQGILYQNFPEKNTELLERLLTISLDLISNPSIYPSEKLWWFIMEVYDIVFHQVRLDEYPAICAELYFKLSGEVMDEEFHQFYKSDISIEAYGNCIYFIQMADNWFSKREQEFIVLYEKMKPLINDDPDHLEKPWVDRYKELNANKN